MQIGMNHVSLQAVPAVGRFLSPGGMVKIFTAFTNLASNGEVNFTTISKRHALYPVKPLHSVLRIAVGAKVIIVRD